MDTKTYLAANGHLMEYFVDENGKLENGYAWKAWCAENCGACEEGMPLPDW